MGVSGAEKNEKVGPGDVGGGGHSQRSGNNAEYLKYINSKLRFFYLVRCTLQIDLAAKSPPPKKNKTIMVQMEIEGCAWQRRTVRTSLGTKFVKSSSQNQ